MAAANPHPTVTLTVTNCHINCHPELVEGQPLSNGDLWRPPSTSSGQALDKLGVTGELLDDDADRFEIAVVGALHSNAGLLLEF